MSVNPFSVPEFSLPHPDLFFLASEQEIYDYRNLYSFTAWFEEIIRDFPIGEGRPLLLLSESSNRLVFVLAACWLLRKPFLSLSPRMTDRELEDVLARIEPAAAFTDEANRDRIGPIPHLEVDDFRLSGSQSIDPERFSGGDPQQLLGYFLTSGTTGVPKLVPVRRRQILFAARASADNFQPGENRYWLLCLPLNHTGGVTIIIRCLLYRAAIFRMDRFDEEQIITFLSENRLIQIASMVPTMLKRLLEYPRFRTHLEFKALLLGGGPITPTLIRKSIERGVPAVASYGMTETCGQIAANPFLSPSGIYHPKSSVGRVFSPNTAQIRDEKGNELPPNESGILWLRGPQVFDGYYDEEDNQDKFDRDGWFCTDDYAHLNRERQLFIHARRSDLILTGGENVYPHEIEVLLEEMEEIREAAVTGLPDEEWGQMVAAFLVPATDSPPSAEELKQRLEKRLSSYKIPKKFIWLEEFPRTESGKIQKKKLVEIHAPKP